MYPWEDWRPFLVASESCPFFVRLEMTVVYFNHTRSNCGLPWSNKVDGLFGTPLDTDWRFNVMVIYPSVNN